MLGKANLFWHRQQISSWLLGRGKGAVQNLLSHLWGQTFLLSAIGGLRDSKHLLRASPTVRDFYIYCLWCCFQAAISSNLITKWRKGKCSFLKAVLGNKYPTMWLLLCQAIFNPHLNQGKSESMAGLERNQPFPGSLCRAGLWRLLPSLTKSPASNLRVAQDRAHFNKSGREHWTQQ